MWWPTSPSSRPLRLTSYDSAQRPHRYPEYPLLVASKVTCLCTLLLAVFSFTPTVEARKSENINSAGIGAPRQLFTSSVAYCSPPLAILVTDLDLSFFPGNSTLNFALAAASTQPDLNVSIALSINAYGLGLINVEINLCDLAAGILCPLPTYNFNGGGIFPVPTSFSTRVPNIAYSIPDLEAVATLQLKEVSSGDVVGCVQATLSNGHTTHQKGAIYATVGLAALAAVSSLLHVCIAQSGGAAQWRIVDVMMSLQHVAISSFLSLTYPIAFLSYALNFGWSVGIIDIPKMQRSITDTRAKTGGESKGLFGNALIASTGRKYNPFENPSVTTAPATSGIGSVGLSRVAAVQQHNTSIVSTVLSLRPHSSYAYSKYGVLSRATNLTVLEAELAKRQYAPNTGPNGQLLTLSDTSPLPLVLNDQTSDEGIAMYGERLNVAPSNVFLTFLVFAVAFTALAIAALVLVYLVSIAVRAFTPHKKHGWAHRFSSPCEFFGILLPAVLGRLYLIILPIFFIFAFYQWAHGDSWVPHLVAALVLVIMLAIGALYFWPMFRHARRGSAEDLYFGDMPPAQASAVARRWGAMAHPYRPKFYWFAMVFLVMAFIRACFISFAQGHGFRQSVGLLVLEVIFTVVLCIFRVGRDKKSDFVFIVLAITRVLSWAVCVAFTHEADVQTIPRVVVGFVLIVVTGLPIIFLFIVTVVDLISPLRKKKLMPSHSRDRTAQEDMQQREDYQYGHVGAGAGTGAGAGAAAGNGDATLVSDPPLQHGSEDKAEKTQQPAVDADDSFATPPLQPATSSSLSAVSTDAGAHSAPTQAHAL